MSYANTQKKSVTSDKSKGDTKQTKEASCAGRNGKRGIKHLNANATVRRRRKSKKGKSNMTDHEVSSRQQVEQVRHNKATESIQREGNKLGLVGRIFGGIPGAVGKVASAGLNHPS